MGFFATLFLVSVLVAATWMTFWGSLAAHYSRKRGRSTQRGFLWGFALGPIGLAVVLLADREDGAGRNLLTGQPADDFEW
jgi:threonine/homoserine/homoserine lactone efflux protein